MLKYLLSPKTFFEPPMKPRHKYQPSGFDDEVNEEEDEKMETSMTGAGFKGWLTYEKWWLNQSKLLISWSFMGQKSSFLRGKSRNEMVFSSYVKVPGVSFFQCLMVGFSNTYDDSYHWTYP